MAASRYSSIHANSRLSGLSHRGKNANKRGKLAIEKLESRRLLAAFIVDIFTDSVGGLCDPGGSGNNVCSLRDAIIAANASPGADTITLAPGTYSLSILNSSLLDATEGDLNITDDLTIVGSPTNPAATIIDAAQIDRAFSVSSGNLGSVTAIFSGLTIQNGLVTNALPGGGIDAASSTNLEIRNSVLRGNRVDSSIFNSGDADGGAIASSGNVLLDGATITNNNAEAFGGGIAMHSDGTLSIFNSRITNNTAGNQGGGIWAGNGGDQIIEISQTTIADNESVESEGGGLYVFSGSSGGTVTLNTVDFLRNRSGLSGGGAYLYDVSSITQTGGSYDNNAAGDAGGGLYLLDSGAVIVDGTTFTNNNSLNGGGGAAVLSDATFRNVLFQQNQVTGTPPPGQLRFDLGGGGLALASDFGISGPTVRIENSSIIQNTAALAGGIGAANVNLEIINTTIRDNQAIDPDTTAGAGGIGFAQADTLGVANDRVRLTIQSSTISNNISAAEAGGVGVADADVIITDTNITGNVANNGRGGGIGIIGLNNSPILQLDRVTVDNNSASGSGGGIAVIDASYFFNNTTISSNVANGNGGGIAFSSSNPLVTGTIKFSTIVSNRVVNAFGSNVAVNGSVTTFLSSIVAEPLGEFPIINMISGGPGELSSLGFNLFSNSNFSNPSTSDLLGVDPLLDVLADNGGAVFTHSLLAGSPAIDAGSNDILAVDARGSARPADGEGNGIATNDIGAFEAEAGVIALPQTDLAITKMLETTSGIPITSGPAQTGDTVVYRLTINNLGPDIATGVTVVDTLPFGVTFVSGSINGGASGVGVSFDSFTRQITALVGNVATATPAVILLTVAINANSPNLLSNTATVTNSPDTDANTANDTASLDTSVNRVVDLAIAKAISTASGDNTTAVFGAPVTFVITVTNVATSPGDARGFTVTDTLPSGLTFVTGSFISGNSGVSLTNAGQLLAFNGGSLSVGQSVSFQFDALVAQTASASLTNTAIVAPFNSGTIADIDINNANNSDSESIVPSRNVELVVTKDDNLVDSSFAVPGGLITYTILVSNTGVSDAINVNVLDTLPAGLTAVSFAIGNVPIVDNNPDPNLLEFVIPSLPTGLANAVTIQVVASIATDVTATNITNLVVVSGGGVGDSPVDNTASVTTPLSPIDPDVTLHTLSTGDGDGDITIQVDSLGTFGTDSTSAFSGLALFNPVGPLPQENVVFLSTAGIRDPELNRYQALQAASNSISISQSISGTSQQATSIFSYGPYSVSLVQSVVPRFGAEQTRLGSQLIQEYRFTNNTTSAQSLDLVRYLDADLMFESSSTDGGGVAQDETGNLILFSTDAAGTSTTATTFVGITNSVGEPLTSIRFDVDDFRVLKDRLFTTGAPLRDVVSGDLNGDGFIDASNPYDVATAIRNVTTLAPGATTSFTTRTLFGNQPSSVLPPIMADIMGVVSCDANGNDVIDLDEAKSGVTVFIDENGNRLLDSNEANTLTDSTGTYRFTDLGLADGHVANVVVQNPPSCVVNAPEIAVTRSSFPTGALSRGLVATDFDNDGDEDLLVVNELGNDVSVLLNDDNSGSFTLGDPIPIGQRSVAIAAWQSSPESSPVIAVASVGTSSNQGSIHVIENGQVTRQLSAGNGPVSVAVNDFNGDGEADFIVAAMRSDTIVGRMSGESGERVLATARSPKSVTAARINDDNFIDMVVVAFGYQGDDSSEVIVLLGDGQGNFTPQRQTISGQGSVDVAVANFDSDAEDEIVVGNYNGSVRVYDFASGGLIQIASVNTEVGIESIAARDVNQDGRADLVIANSRAETVELFINEPTGFIRNRTITGVPSPSDIVVANFDGDGILDVAVTNLYGTSQPNFTLPSSVTILGLTVSEREVTVAANQTATANFGLVVSPPTPRSTLPAALQEFDVNGSGSVTGLDAILIINAISRNQKGEGETTSTSRMKTLDVNGDAKLTALDALLVINHMAKQQRSTRLEGKLVAAPPNAKRELHERATDAAFADIGILF